MGAVVAITRLELTASELRRAAQREKNSTAARRILALALVLEGTDRRKAAESCGMDRQTLRDWVHRYNAEGLAGLRSRKPLGPSSKLTAQQETELAALVEAGPDPAQHGVVRWRRIDLWRYRTFRVGGYRSLKYQHGNHSRSYGSFYFAILGPRTPALHPAWLLRIDPACRDPRLRTAMVANEILDAVRDDRQVHQKRGKISHRP